MIDQNGLKSHEKNYEVLIFKKFWGFRRATLLLA